MWPPLVLGTLFLLFFVGGIAGSTGGGPKVVRYVLLFKNSFKELKQLVHPQALVPTRLGGQVVPDDVMRNVLSFIVLYFMLTAFGIAVMALLGLDLISAFGATIACVGNIGPGFGDFGPTDNYAQILDPRKVDPRAADDGRAAGNLYRAGGPRVGLLAAVEFGVRGSAFAGESVGAIPCGRPDSLWSPCQEKAVVDRCEEQEGGPGRGRRDGGGALQHITKQPPHAGCVRSL